jgi:hypothetical protein
VLKRLLLQAGPFRSLAIASDRIFPSKGRLLATLLRRPGFAASKSFVAWNVSGILDLTVAVSIGALVPLLAPNFYGAVSTAPMSQLPLVLIPTYLVPTFVILHLAALFQARRLDR